uniref:Uncharacterized protein n=1 Tax=Acrobeloides nanus TaxID=290746 RepID=A0A914D5P9_9BILA
MQILQDDQQAPVSREDAESSDEEIQGGEADAEEARLTQRHHDDAAEYQGEEEEIGDVQTEKKIEDEIEFEEILDDSEVDDEEEQADNSNVVDEETPVVLTKDKKTGPPEATRIAKALHSSSLIANYKFDPKSNRWCVVTFQLPVKRTKLDFSAIVEREIDEFIVSQTPDIEKCLVDEEKRNGEDVKILKTQGVNLQ